MWKLAMGQPTVIGPCQMPSCCIHSARLQLTTLWHLLATHLALGASKPMVQFSASC